MENETIQIFANQVDIADYEEVLRRDPEHADLGNPQGNVYGIRYYVRVTLESGARYLHYKAFSRTDLDDAVTLQVAVSKRREINLKHWAEVDPAYGSSDWRDADVEREYQFSSALAAGDYERADLYC